MKNICGEVITNQTSIANLLDSKSSKLGDYLGSFSKYIKTFKFATKKSFKFQPISIYKSQKVLRSLNCNKPLGRSNIPAWALKDCIKIIAEPLTFSINSLLYEGCFPNHLKEAHVIPVFKNGVVEDPINYRPISISSALTKVFEKVISEQINDYLRLNVDITNFVAAAMLDLSKAFDSTSHEILCKKLEAFNFDAKAISVVKDFLTNRIQKEVLPTCSSEWINLYQGVSHGTTLGPLLFNLYINTLQFNIAKPCELVQYANDIFLFSAGTELNDAISNLQMNIEKLVTFFESHKLNLIENKTELIVFSKRSRNHLKSNLNLKGENTTFK